MAIIIPFKALRYDSSRLNMANVVAPPYDIISPAEQEALYGRDPHNIIRLELTKEEPGDDEKKNKYSRAAQILEDWLEKGILKKDPAKSFYLYETVFLDPETKKMKRRLVIFGLIKLEPFQTKTVLPHEKTHSRPKEDRMKLIKATHTNFSPVFGLYADSDQLVKDIYSKLDKTPPLFAFDLEKGEGHRLWAIAQSKDIEAISRMFQSKSILIADGHHRYETALQYGIDQRKLAEGKGELPSDYALMGFVEMEDEGLLIFPIHRMIKNLSNSNFKTVDFLEKTSFLFNCEKADSAALQAISKGEKRDSFGAFFGGESYIFRLKNQEAARKEMPEGKPEVWYKLEVAQISHLLLKRLGVDEKHLENHLEYTRFADEAIQKVKAKEADLCFIVPPIQAKVMREICMSGELMPQKSTYFYPKLGSGYLMHRHI